MKSKKGQEGIIVTVLLILIAIAIVGVVAYFIMNQVKQGTETAGLKADCLKVSLFIDKAAQNQIVISRGNDNVNLSNIKLFVDGKAYPFTFTLPKPLETQNNSWYFPTGNKIKIYPVISGYTCENGLEAVITEA